LSVTEFRNRFVSCGAVAAAVLALILVAGLIFFPGGPSGSSGDPKLILGEPAIVVNGEPIYSGKLGDLVQRAQQMDIQNRAGSPGGAQLGPFDYLDSYTRALDDAMSIALVLGLAKKAGIEVTEEALPGFFDARMKEERENVLKTIEMLYQSETSRLEAEVATANKDKGADSKEAKDAAAKLQTHRALTLDGYYANMAQGRTLAQVSEEQRKQLDQQLKNPLAVQDFLAQMAQSKLQDAAEAKVDVSDAALKASYDKVTYQQILITSQDTPDPKAKAAEVLAKVEGGMPFLDAFAQFSSIKGDGTKKPEEVATSTLTRFEILSAGTYSDILDLKPGEVSEVIELPTGASIYKLIKVEPAVPEKFNELKAERSRLMKQTLGGKGVADQIEEAKKTAKIEWKAAGWKAVHDYSDLRSGERSKQLDGAQNQAARIAAYREVMTAADAAGGEDPALGAFLKFACFQQIDTATAPGPEKDKLAEERLAAYAGVAEYVSSIPFKFEYVNLLLAAQEGDLALTQLMDVAVASSDYTPENKINIDRVEALLPQAANHAPKDSPKIAAVQKEIKYARDNEAEAKRLEEEEKKAAAGAIPPGGAVQPPATGGADKSKAGAPTGQPGG
jgi:hypothetical protein